MDIGTLVSENRVCMITMAALAVLLCVGWFTSFAIPSLLPVILVISAIQRREPLRWLALAAVIVVLPLIALTPALRG